MDKPERQTRERIERDLEEKRRRAQATFERLARHFALRKADVEAMVRRNSRRRPPGMAPALVEPPRGPKPLAGGAAAPFEFD